MTAPVADDACSPPAAGAASAAPGRAAPGGAATPRAAAAPARRVAAVAGLALFALVPGWRDSPAPPAPLRVAVSGGGVATAVATGSGRVLTVAHVVDGARFVRVAGRPATVLRVDRRLDIAELAVPGLDAGSVRTAGGSGDAVVRVLRDGRAVTFSAHVRRRVTASIAGYSRPALELAAPILPGDSGAPVLDSRGRVLGIVFARGARSAWAVDVSSG